MSNERRYHDALRRRDVLRVGSLGAFGFGLNLPQMLSLETAHADAKLPGPRREVSVIYLFLAGGLSTIDTFDMKPDAPTEVRGEFDSISTTVPGIRYCEHLPRLARHATKLSLIRSFVHGNNGHGEADKYMLTGYLREERPSFGSIISEAGHAQPGGRNVPPYVVFPRMHPAAGPAFLGSTHAPFFIDADPSDPGFAVPDLIPPLEVDSTRLADRTRLLHQVDRLHRHVDRRSQAASFAKFRERAFRLMTSSEAKSAFDIQAETESVRTAYGSHTLGQSCLLARRLVQAGVRYTMITHNNWDTHENNFGALKTNLLPQLDQGVSALLGDLEDRGLLDSTLVVITGEFGRTPKINKNAGRDHWGNCFTVALAGGGVQGGRIHGESDKWTNAPTKDPVRPLDFAATMFHILGLDPRRVVHALDGRPMHLLDEGRIIRELL